MYIVFSIISTLYYISSLIILIFCIFQFILFIQYVLKRGVRKQELPIKETPHVTIQLPIYNEKYVIERLVQAVCQIEYPNEKLEIQICDDSTDDTTEILNKAVELWKAKGKNIIVRKRQNRLGYKAGALREGLSECKGEFICIFDADFVPEPTFLMDTISNFQDPTVGVVQTRWTHLNEEENILTKLQAIPLNVHFTVEQAGRYYSNKFLQFNGTAGVWRRTTIEQSGNWQDDTLTEDLDLSYRAQINGWKIVYDENTIAPAELPSEIGSVKSQQFRWMKGGAQSAKKILPLLFRSGVPLRQKLWSTQHLLNSSVYVLIFLMAILSLPMMISNNSNEQKGIGTTELISSLPFILIVYFFINVLVINKSTKLIGRIMQFAVYFPMFLALSVGISLHNSYAVIQGWLGYKSSFKRTPKRGDQEYGYISKISNLTYLEGLLAIYFLLAIYLGLSLKISGYLLFHLLCFIGYSTIFYLSLKSKFNKNAAR
jgi:cellulose synthase/poly-beta-1,6-N-acetylglucosamine synthase-like glycosyltransferase